MPRKKRVKIILDTNFWISFIISDKIKYLDNFLLNLAFDSNADYLVTGDNDLLEIKSISKTRIISLRDLEELFG